jgi:hypothetical protein
MSSIFETHGTSGRGARSSHSFSGTKIIQSKQDRKFYHFSARNDAFCIREFVDNGFVERARVRTGQDPDAITRLPDEFDIIEPAQWPVYGDAYTPDVARKWVEYFNNLKSRKI